MKKWLAIITRIIAVISSFLLVLKILIRFLNFRYFRIEVHGLSMVPSLHSKDYLIVEKSDGTSIHPPASIVVMQDSDNNIFLKRIIGIPGESIQVGDEVRINGKILIERYAWGGTPNSRYRGVNRLAQDEYFLIGDNRSVSKPDSRDFGPVTKSRILGKVIYRYWPPARIGKFKPEIRKFEPTDEEN